MSKIAILGYGTIGSGVAEIIRTNNEILQKKAGKAMDLKYVLDLREFPGDPCEKILTHDFQDIVNDPEVDIVVETMGGTKPAYDFVKQCLQAGKSVCTSNKELVAKHGPELLAIAKEKGGSFLFEASCGGGIPIIRPLVTSLTADDIDEISGILNGTTNYILTKMAKEGLSYDVALKQAQELGYAEKNPEADVEGYDPCRKIAILSSLVFGKNVDFEEISTEGITKITAEDIQYMRMCKRQIKLIASCKKVDGKVYAMVAPFAVKDSHPLACVEYVMNAIFVHGNMLGDTMYYGSGAGKLPTASAVVSDAVSMAISDYQTTQTVWSPEKVELTSTEQDRRQFFVRVSEDKLEAAQRLFDFEEVLKITALKDEAGLITGEMSEKEFAEKANEIGIISRIRLK